MPIRTIGIISKPKKAEIRGVVTPLISWLGKHNVKVLIDRETSSMLDISDQGVSLGGANDQRGLVPARAPAPAEDALGMCRRHVGGGDGVAHSRVLACQGFCTARLPNSRLQIILITRRTWANPRTTALMVMNSLIGCRC